MNYLQRYLDLRGITCRDIAQGTGHGYHSIQKTVKGVRCPLKIRDAIARYLGLDAQKLWGRGSILYLRALIAAEAARQAEVTRQEIERKYLGNAASIKPNMEAVNV